MSYESKIKKAYQNREDQVRRQALQILLTVILITPSIYWTAPVAADERLVTLKSDISDLMASPQGDKIAVISGPENTLRIIRLKDKKIFILENSTRGNRALNWSPDGQQITYITAGKMGGEPYRLVVADLRTGKKKILDRSKNLGNGMFSTPHGLSWSPDGKKIAYTILEGPKFSEGTSFSLWVSESNGKEKKRLLSSKIEISLQGWTLDSQHLIITEVHPGAESSFIKQVDLHGKENVLPVKSGGGLLLFFGYTSNGDYVLCRHRIGEDRDEIWKVTSDGQIRDRLTGRNIIYHRGQPMSGGPILVQDERDNLLILDPDSFREQQIPPVAWRSKALIPYITSGGLLFTAGADRRTINRLDGAGEKFQGASPNSNQNITGNKLPDGQEAPRLTAGYNPPGIDGLLKAIKESDIAKDGNIEITYNIKREFNQMGEDYRFFFMPEVAWYRFESTGAAISYVLFIWAGEFGSFPEKAPKYEAEARLRKIFAAPNNEYPKLEHQAYMKFVKFDGEAYTPWPGSYNADNMIYDLVELKIRQEGDYTYYTATANEYGFNVIGIGYYEPGENEKLLIAKAEALGLDYNDTLEKLLEAGDIIEAKKSRTYTIEFRVEGDNTTPMIVSVDK